MYMISIFGNGCAFAFPVLDNAFCYHLEGVATLVREGDILSASPGGRGDYASGVMFPYHHHPGMYCPSDPKRPRSLRILGVWQLSLCNYANDFACILIVESSSSTASSVLQVMRTTGWSVM